MVKWLKELIKKLPGIRRVVEGRDRFIGLYEEQVATNVRISEQYAAAENYSKKLEQDLNAREKECAALQEENSALSSRILQVTDHTAYLENENHAKAVKIDEQRNELQRLCEKIAFLEEGKEQADRRNALLEEEKENHRQQNILLRADVEQLQQQCAVLEKDGASCHLRISDLENEIQQKEAALQVFDYARKSSELSSGDFWNNHYAFGGNSGTGSYCRLADFKAEVVNRLLQEFGISTAIEIGCGDGNQLSLINYPSYTGVDVSQVIIEKNRERYAGCEDREFFCSLTEREKYIHNHYDLGVSMDVIFHLLEDDVFSAYMNDLFTLATRYVVIYSSNHEEYTPWPEYRHRNFTGYISEHFPHWELVRYIPNRYPYIFGSEGDTSSSDFYIYKNILRQ